MQIIIELNELIEKLDTQVERSQSKDGSCICLTFDEVESIKQTLMAVIDEIAEM